LNDIFYIFYIFVEGLKVAADKTEGIVDFMGNPGG
tara:strand:- start:1520 stop:1624 length:105 start_codon:yes stop_codon:yes gene_type:complete